MANKKKQQQQQLSGEDQHNKLKLPPKAHLSGEVKIVKHGATKYKTRPLFARLHGEASDKVTRFITQQNDVPDNTNKYRLAEAGPSQAKPTSCPQLGCAQFSASPQPSYAPSLSKPTPGYAQFSTKMNRVKQTREIRCEDDPADTFTRPSTAGSMLGAAAGKTKRGGSATSRRKDSCRKNESWLKNGWNIGGGDNNLVPTGFMTLEDVLDHRAAAIVPMLSLPGGPMMVDGHERRNDFDKQPPSDLASQWGSSVLYNRTLAELGGPGRTKLLRSVFDQHLTETSLEDWP